jgi:hypothetical protein
MWRRLLIGVGLLALFAAGVGLGMFVQYRFQPAVTEVIAGQSKGWEQVKDESSASDKPPLPGVIRGVGVKYDEVMGESSVSESLDDVQYEGGKLWANLLATGKGRKPARWECHLSLSTPPGSSMTFNGPGAGFDLRLMSSLNDASDIPREGKNLIIVAAVANALHFRIFGVGGKVIFDDDEEQLRGESRRIEILSLRKRLKSLWPPHELSSRERADLIATVTSIFNLKTGVRYGDSVGLRLSEYGEEIIDSVWHTDMEGEKYEKVSFDLSLKDLAEIAEFQRRPKLNGKDLVFSDEFKGKLKKAIIAMRRASE